MCGIYCVYKQSRYCQLPFCASPIFHFEIGDFSIYLSTILFTYTLIAWMVKTATNVCTYIAYQHMQIYGTVCSSFLINTRITMELVIRVSSLYESNDTSVHMHLNLKF